MPSPFPGMDPYLEGEMWQEFHETLANAIRAQLMPLLGPRYVALLAKRYVLNRSALGIYDLLSEGVLYPDVHIVAPLGERLAEERTLYTSPPSTASIVDEPVAELPSPVLDEVPLLRVEIRDVARRRLVTLIEILSPVNKQSQGASEYAERRMDLMQAAIHLLEIDLLRRGQRIQLLGEPPSADYYVYLSRSQRRPNTEIWPISLRERLPVVPVPLLHPDADVALDLQAAVRACFELVGYEHLLDYANPPPPPKLNAADTAWVEKCLRKAGLHSEPKEGNGE
jgi:hypothetical protein